jgi:hypothetical protein
MRRDIHESLTFRATNSAMAAGIDSLYSSRQVIRRAAVNPASIGERRHSGMTIERHTDHVGLGLRAIASGWW